jgi:hypothetical protein
MSLTAIVKGNTIKLPVSVPDGTEVEIVLPDGIAEAAVPTGSFLDGLLPKKPVFRRDFDD